MSSNPQLEDLADEVQRLEDALASEINAARRSSRATLAIASVLGLVIVAFVVVTYLQLAKEWTEEKFSRSLQKEFQELRPQAMKEISLLSQELLPVYAEEGKRQLAAMAPEISAKFQAELDNLSGDLLQGVHTRLLTTEERVLAQTEKVLFESYPELSDGAQMEELRKRFRAVVETAVTDAIGDFDRKFAPEVEELKKTLTSFDLSDNEMDTVDMQKKMIHLWLQLLDQEIMAL